MPGGLLMVDMSTLIIRLEDFGLEPVPATATITPTATVRDGGTILLPKMPPIDITDGEATLTLPTSDDVTSYRIMIRAGSYADTLGWPRPGRVLAGGRFHLPPGTHSLAELPFLDQPDPAVNYPRLAELLAATSEAAGLADDLRTFDAGNLVLDAREARDAAQSAAGAVAGAVVQAGEALGIAEQAATDVAVAATRVELAGVDSREWIDHTSTAPQGAQLAAALTAAAESLTKTLRLAPGTITLDAPVAVPAGVTLAADLGAEIQLAGNHHGLTLGDGSRVVGLTIQGTNPAGGVATLTAQGGIRAVGSAPDYITGIDVIDCTFIGLHDYGVVLRHVDGFQVRGCRFYDTGYAAVSVNGSHNGWITGCYIKGTGVLPAAYPNSYGVAITLSSGTISESNPRPSKILVSHNVVENQAWEALDTHGGTEIVFDSNVIRDSEMGIAVTIREGLPGGFPENCTVSNNVIVAGTYPATARRGGISINGESNTVRATASVVGNTVVGYGTSATHPAQASRMAAAIAVNKIRTFVASGNTVRDSLGAAFRLWRVTSGSITGNVIEGVWREDGDTDRSSAAILLHDCDEEPIVISGNAYSFGDYGRTNTCERAVYCFSDDPGSLMLDHGNSWASIPHERVVQARTRGSINDGLDLGGVIRSNGLSRELGATPLASATGDDPISAFPPGESHRNATSAGTNNWPFNGLLITHHYDARGFQVIYEYAGTGSTGFRMARRGTDANGTWGPWVTFTGTEMA